MIRNEFTYETQIGNDIKFPTQKNWLDSVNNKLLSVKIIISTS